MPQQHKRPNLIRDTRVASQPSLQRALQDGPLDDVPILLLKRLPRPARDLPPELDGIARVRVAEVRAGVFALEERGVEDVCAGVFEGRERGGFGGDFGEEVEDVSELQGALLWLVGCEDVGLFFLV